MKRGQMKCVNYCLFMVYQNLRYIKIIQISHKIFNLSSVEKSPFIKFISLHKEVYLYNRDVNWFI